MGAMEQIGLAHEPAFVLGGVAVRPGTRELERDGVIEVVEPRVMKVLVALVHAKGGVLSRDDLIGACWEGRVVGEDAINRVMSRLRRVAEGIGARSFRVETITKVGYRLVTAVNGAEPDERTGVAETGSLSSLLVRRRLLVGGVLAAGVAGLGAWRLAPERVTPAPPTPLSTRLLNQSLAAMCQGTKTGQDEAIGTLRYVVAEQPDFADGWGALAMTYALSATWRPATEAQAFRERSRAAAERAEAIDPSNSFVAVARAAAVPMRGNWLGMDRALRRSIALYPRQDWLLLALGLLCGHVGRHGESATLFARLRQSRPEHSPALYYNEIISAWSANRLEEADRLIEEASQLFPSHFLVWLARFLVNLYTGRAAAAQAMLDDRDGRPGAVPAPEAEALATMARAMLSRAPADVDAALRIWLPRARLQTFDCERTIHFSAALDRIEDAFTLLRAFYFDADLGRPDGASPAAHDDLRSLADRPTAFLFYPPMASVRRDARFAALTRELGLDRYWHESGQPPDYRRA